jgi:hypothetical protein
MHARYTRVYVEYEYKQAKSKIHLAKIYFDDLHICKNRNHIPLDKETGQPHQCDE